ncbi:MULTISPECIES: SMC-Scp complex subunit ScpB [Oligella]|uniref:Condensin subunit ScpB n=1 Tax=Oligella urethralis DNF00040 TaxID=1401065 RepID=A0A095Z4B1_9BURK|nr:MULTISPECIES: SMC-Scp complex subunit ScpB [Oligella]KGF29176.1 condensin subunit ScpB [Oligella urethralis DNF00040]OFS84533.1 SMC-Scp complex subunit ScpB [Oligella sp. HMSC05A10]
MDLPELGRVVEAVLLCADEPMSINQITKLFAEHEEVDRAMVLQAIEQLQLAWVDRGLALVEVAEGWRFQSRPAMQKYFELINPERPPRYSRAVMETLAIIAWCYPVTRGDIESIRGVTVSSQIIKTLEDRGWIEVVGYRDGPGRPSLLGITEQFWSDLGLQSRADLPPLESFHDALVADDESYASLQQEIALALGEAGEAPQQLSSSSDDEVVMTAGSANEIAPVNEQLENRSESDQ